ncbi:hypothetical protein MITS9509_00981 [Synechococcus sp. MIT S9509]|uniref:hypothetical protein n=1 Tax=Synechococcus sp. MIT S9509 TaxID=1801630 RepID=UPI0007BBBC99|nr:hypothetical protein [Synechococcus sp. MIT S9509]KZR93104.1 hypothetical protein MITS9509_00981 [Synechococcus sp. MIT S9509]
MTPEQAFSEAKQLYESEKPVGWRSFSMGSIRVPERPEWYAKQVRKAYPFDDWETAERQFCGDLLTVLAYVNKGLDPNLVGDVLYGFRRLCRNASKIADRIHNEDPADLKRRLGIFGLNG